MSQFLSLFVSGAVFVILAVPPAFALWMVLNRLRKVAANRRMTYQALAALTGLVLAFNLLVWAGMPPVLRSLLPGLVDRNLGYAGLLASWASVGLCLLLVVLHPYRRRSSV
jgi:hypothetical protein